MPPTTNYDYGDVLLVYYWHTDGKRQEKRPALVVSTNSHNQEHPDAVLAAITSQVWQAQKDDAAVEIPEWQNAGLLKPSVIKPILFSYEQTEVLQRLGQIGAETARKTKIVIARMLGFTLSPRRSAAPPPRP